MWQIMDRIISFWSILQLEIKKNTENSSWPTYKVSPYTSYIWAYDPFQWSSKWATWGDNLTYNGLFHLIYNWCLGPTCSKKTAKGCHLQNHRWQNRSDFRCEKQNVAGWTGPSSTRTRKAWKLPAKDCASFDGPYLENVEHVMNMSTIRGKYFHGWTWLTFTTYI